MTKPKEGAKKGRPSKYTPAVVEEIADRLAQGQTLKQITDDPNMPALMTVLEWQREKPDFHSILARARMAQVESMVGIMWEEALSADADSVRVADLRIKTLQWLLARYDPKRYSERVLAEVAKLPEPMKDVTPEVDTTHMTYEERENLRQLILAAERRKKAALIEYKEEQADDGTDRSANRTED